VEGGESEKSGPATGGGVCPLFFEIGRFAGLQKLAHPDTFFEVTFNSKNFGTLFRPIGANGAEIKNLCFSEKFFFYFLFRKWILHSKRGQKNIGLFFLHVMGLQNRFFDKFDF
jgi:hypothetical protein